MKQLLRNLVFLLGFTAFVSCTPTDDNPIEPTPQKPTFENFAFTDEGTAHTSLSLNIIPKDKDMEYILLLAEKKHFVLNGIDSREELLEDDYNFLSSYAAQYGMGLHEFLEKAQWLTCGDKMDYKATNLYPNTEYVVYCYGVTFNGDSYEATTEIAYAELKTTTPELTDVKFSVESRMKGNVANIAIDPNGYDGLYYYYIVSEQSREYIPEGTEVGEAYIEMYRNNTYIMFNSLINDNGIPAKDFCLQGRQTIEERLEPNMQYSIILFSVSDDQTPILNSVPTVAYFTSGEMSKSDLTIDIEVSDITAYNAKLTVTPSNNEESYACVFISKEQVPTVDNDYLMMTTIIENFLPSVFTGVISENLTPLMPSTEYAVIAFGIDAEKQIPTTDLFALYFTSEEASKGAVEITSIDIVKVFDAQEIIALDARYNNYFAECECVAIVEAKTNVPCDKLYFWWYEGWMKIEYSHEAFIEDLLMYPYANNPEIMDMFYSLDEEDQFFFAGMAEDEEGNLSEVYYGENFVLSKEMTSPAEEFFQMIAPEATTHRAIIGR